MVNKQTISIEGQKFGMFLSDINTAKPFILYVHGGPGSPEYALFQHKLSKSYFSDFNVCYYDQRGSGLSFKTKEPLTLSSHINDVLKIANYLRVTYNHKKIILMGHSFGTFLCIKAIHIQPEIFSSYIGISQLVNPLESEFKIYEKLLKLSISIEDEVGYQLLQANKSEMKSMTYHYMKNIKTPLIMKHKIGLMHQDLSETFILKTLLLSKCYSVKEKIYYIRGLKRTHNEIFNSIKKINLNNNFIDINIPILLVHGEHDGQVSLECAQEFFEHLKQDSKKFLIIKNSAHFPNIEKPELFESSVIEFLNEFVSI